LPPLVTRTSRLGIYDPKWRQILAAICNRHRIPEADVLGPSRKAPIAACRHDAIREVWARTHMSLLMVAHCFNRDHTSILNSLGRRGSRKVAA
jgi:chromosomal replication initiation ATPase DnaA